MERSGAERAGRDGANDAPRLLDSLTVGIWVVDRNGKTLTVNDAAARMTGRPSEGLRGRHVAEVIELPPGDEDWRAGDYGPPADRRLHRPDGSWIWAEVLARPASEEAAPPGSTVLTLLEVTERRRREAALHARADGGEVLAQFAELLLLGAEADDYLTRAVTLLAEELALPLLAIGTASRDETEVQPIAIAGPIAEADPERWRGPQLVPKNGATMTALRTGRTVVVDNYREPGTYASGPVINATDAIGSTTIPVSGNTWLAAFSEEPGTFDADAVGLLESVSRLLAARWPSGATPSVSGVS